jgi:hypothetical protein
MRQTGGPPAGVTDVHGRRPRGDGRGGDSLPSWLTVAALRTELLFAPRPCSPLGVGPRSRANLARALDEAGPAGVLVLGFCGGLRASLSPGDLLLADRVVDAEGEVQIAPDEVARASRLVSSAHVESLVTVSRTADPGQKARLGLTAAGCDMESSFLARELVARELPFVIVRVVLDALWEDLPSGLSSVLWAPRAIACARRLGGAAHALLDGRSPCPDRRHHIRGRP